MRQQQADRNGHVYRAFNHVTSWANAREYCRSLGGDLAVITTGEEKELVAALIEKAQFAEAILPEITGLVLK